jgi:3-oxoacyl-(acyl-carrier-protein) synthase
VVTWLGSTSDSAATEVEIAASRAGVKVSIGSAATKPITNWYVVTATAPGTEGDGGRGEGAGVLLLETEEHALKRGAKIYCELAGYAANCDAFHITAPHPEGEGMSDCLQMAVESAGIKLTDVQYVNAHGTSTPLNDKFETMAYKRVFGDHAHKLKISSTKGALGHLLGAAGSVEAAICCKVIETGSMPPTLNYKTPDRKSTRLNSSHWITPRISRMPSSA